MFKRDVKKIDDLVNIFLRNQGLETPLLQHRIIDAWETVAGPAVAAFTDNKFIKNQTLFVRILNPALRYDLSMRRSQLVRQLNHYVGAMVITDIRIG